MMCAIRYRFHMKIKYNAGVLFFTLMHCFVLYASDKSCIPSFKKSMKISEQAFDRAKKNDNDIVVLQNFSERLHGFYTKTSILEGEDLERVKDFWLRIKPYLMRKMQDNEEILTDIWGLTITFTGVPESQHCAPIELYRSLVHPTIFNTLTKIIIALVEKSEMREYKYPSNIFPSLKREKEQLFNI